MAKYKVIVLMHQLANKRLAKAGETVDESELDGNGPDLEKKGFLKKIPESDEPKSEKLNLGKAKSVEQTISSLKLKYDNALNFRKNLPPTATEKQISTADKKVSGLKSELEVLGFVFPSELNDAELGKKDDTESGKKSEDDSVGKTSEELIKDLTAEFISVSSEKANLEDNASPKDIAALVLKQGNIAAKLLELGVDVATFDKKE